MKILAAPAILIGVLATQLCSVQPCAAASVRVCSIYYQPATGGGLRHPRNPTGDAFTPVSMTCYCPNPNITEPSASVPSDPPSTRMVGSANYGLRYVKISGAAGGGPITIFPDSKGEMPTIVNVPVAVPPQDIDVEYVYFPIGQRAPCSPNQECGTASNFD